LYDELVKKEKKETILKDVYLFCEKKRKFQLNIVPREDQELWGRKGKTPVAARGNKFYDRKRGA